MKAIFKREMKNYLKNPLYWIAVAAVFVLIYQTVSPYLKVQYFQTEEEITGQQTEEGEELDIMQGYVLSKKEQQVEIGLECIKQELMRYKEITQESKIQDSEQNSDTENNSGLIIYWENPNQDPEEVIERVKEHHFETYKEAVGYLEEQEQIWGSEYYFQEAEYHRGDREEVNTYLAQKLEEHPYSYYFARKFADFGGMFMGFFAAILLAPLFLRDMRKDMYELLHTKPIKASSYVAGKVLGGFAVIGFALCIITALFTALCVLHGREAGLPVRVSDVAVHVLLYILPNMLMIASVYAAISLLFKNPLPAIPLLFLYMLYSNMGSRGADGEYGYHGRTLAIMVRFPGSFLDTAPPPLAIWNQSFLLVASAVLVCMTIMIYKRRRFY